MTTGPGGRFYSRGSAIAGAALLAILVTSPSSASPTAYSMAFTPGHLGAHGRGFATLVYSTNYSCGADVNVSSPPSVVASNGSLSLAVNVSVHPCSPISNNTVAAYSAKLGFEGLQFTLPGTGLSSYNVSANWTSGGFGEISIGAVSSGPYPANSSVAYFSLDAGLRLYDLTTRSPVFQHHESFVVTGYKKITSVGGSTFRFGGNSTGSRQSLNITHRTSPSITLHNGDTYAVATWVIVTVQALSHSYSGPTTAAWAEVDFGHGVQSPALSIVQVTK